MVAQKLAGIPEFEIPDAKEIRGAKPRSPALHIHQ
jgi:hypothetical protein